MVIAAFFLIRLNYHLSGAITIREQFIDIIILAERYEIIYLFRHHCKSLPIILGN